MNLKKSDKMIAGIAVLVLIIAAIGIVLYTEKKDDTSLDDDTTDKAMPFEVDYEIVPGSQVNIDNTNFEAKFKLLGDGDYHAMVDIPRQNVKGVTFYFDYTDDKQLLKIFGKDKLTVMVSDADGELIEEHTITGSGNYTITKDKITPMISTAAIEAKSMEEAEDKLMERYEDNPMNVTFKVDVSIKIGEIRLLARLLERLDKDDFTLEVTYDYYKYSVDEPEKEGGDGNPPTNLQPAPARLGSLVALGSSAKW